MPLDQNVRIDPETGVALVRDTRRTTLKYKSQTVEVDLPGWYPQDDPSSDDGVFTPADMKVSDRALNLMKAREAGVMIPAEIKAVRKKLKLSQRDAGRIIGGGPNAFQKYESGDVVLSKAADTALRLLANEPSRISELCGV